MATPLHEKTFPQDDKNKLPQAFVWRRLHSLLGIWLVLYLFEHLLVNSQAAFYLEDDGQGFIAMVNHIHDLPYLRAIEILFLGVPFLIHGIWGVYYALTGKMNSFPTGGKTPSLPQYRRNQAYSWQRITSWILLIGIAAHVIHMRFLDYPTLIYQGLQKTYMTRVEKDRQIAFVAEKIDVKLFDESQLQEKKAAFEKQLNVDTALRQEEKEWIDAATSKPLKEGQLLAVSNTAGGAFLLIMREAFKNPIVVLLYTVLVLSAAFHGLNGLWTFMITWGVTLTRRSQKVMRSITTVLMCLVAALGLLAAWGTFISTWIQPK